MAAYFDDRDVALRDAMTTNAKAMVDRGERK